MKNFNNPVSMRIPSQEAFENDLRKPLEDLVAKFECIVYFGKFPILVSNSSGENGIIENLLDSDKLNFNRHFIETYDPEQFIAICKLEVEMIVGECYTVVDCDGQKMTGYLLKNNSQNIGFNLSGQFKGIGYLGCYFENANITYSSEMHTIRLSTPEEKAKLDKVIAENETPVNENNSFCDKIINEEKIINTFKKAINQIEVNDEIIISDSVVIPKPIKVIDKVKSDLKQAKKKVRLLTEVLKYLENES